jgi:hypothetical protein
MNLTKNDNDEEEKKNDHHNNNNNLVCTVDLDQTLEQLSSAEFGAHFLLTCSNLLIWRKVYAATTKKYLKDDNGMVLIIPFYETTNSVRQILSKEIPNLNSYESQGSLAIIDSIRAYFSEIGLMTFVDGLLRHTKASGKNGLSVFADMGSFYHMRRIHQLLEHEISLPARYDAKLRGYCIYNEGNFAKLTEQQRNSIYEHHGKSLRIVA